MTSFASPAVLPSVTPLDPTKHVNFTRGMVLGVDDLDQQFAYHSARDQWMVRDLIGYGVVSGLRLSVDPPPEGQEEKGPRVGVSAGVAVVPSGELVCVSPAQCAFLGEWVRSQEELLELETSPPVDVRAAVVLCYADCETDAVPIPGEPCRSEENLMAPARVKDSFSLELRLDPPAQLEEQAVRRLAAWLAAVRISDTGTELDLFLAALREAASEEPGSPPVSPPSAGFLEEPPPSGLAIPRARAAEYLSEAFGVWVTELRARWRTPVPGCECPPGPGCPPAEDCLALGEVVVPVTVDALSGELLVGDADEVEIDLSARPTLVHLRLLQQWVLAQRAGNGRLAASVRLDVSPPDVVADGLDVQQIDDRVFHLVPEGFDPGAAYAVTVTGVGAVATAAPLVFELLDPDDPDLATLLGGAAEPGLTVRIQTVAGDPPSRGFVVTADRVAGAP